MMPFKRYNRGSQARGKGAFPKKSIAKRHEHSSHHFHSQCAASSFVLQGIVHFEIPRGKKERKEEKRVKKKK